MRAGWSTPTRPTPRMGAVWERAAPNGPRSSPASRCSPRARTAARPPSSPAAAAATAARRPSCAPAGAPSSRPSFDAGQLARSAPALLGQLRRHGGVDRGGVVPSPARASAGAGGPRRAQVAVRDGGASGGWVEIDRLENVIQKAWTERIVKAARGAGRGPRQAALRGRGRQPDHGRGRSRDRRRRDPLAPARLLRAAAQRRRRRLRHHPRAPRRGSAGGRRSALPCLPSRCLLARRRRAVPLSR